MSTSKDLFDDSTMSFGEHLEELRIRLWKAILGLTVCVCFTLFFGNEIVAIIRRPIDSALKAHSVNAAKVDDNVSGFDIGKWFKKQMGLDAFDKPDEKSVTDSAQNETAVQPGKTGKRDPETITVRVRPSELARILHSAAPEKYPSLPSADDEKAISFELASPSFSQFQRAWESTTTPITLNVQEAFMTWMKVSIIAGVIVGSPWAFLQIWLFVAAGLYPHERKYVYTYLPLSLFLFLAGAVLCYFVALPVVLNFLLGFNKTLGVTPQIRLSEWISFAITLPLMFGISFQLPMVMLFLERISVFDVAAYRKSRRISILVIAILSMFLTPPDPMSMLTMMLPLVALYEFGILMCQWSPSKKAFPGNDGSDGGLGDENPYGSIADRRS